MNTSIMPDELLSAPARRRPRMASEIGVEAAAKYLRSHPHESEGISSMRLLDPTLYLALCAGFLAGRAIPFGRR